MSRSRFTDLTHILKTGHALKKIVRRRKDSNNGNMCDQRQGVASTKEAPA